MATDLIPQLAGLVLLGAIHGVNPAMGWLFAVALGLQRGDRRAVWRAFLPLAAGHALAIAAAVALAALLGVVVPPGVLAWLVGAALAATGVRHLLRHRHARWAPGGMRLRSHELAVWSFLMASAHGAGLMTVPLVLPDRTPAAGAHAGHVVTADGGPVRQEPTRGPPIPDAPPVIRDHGSAPAEARTAWHVVVLATIAHSLGYVMVTCLVALLVYERVGVRVLRAAWLNIDYAWAIALLIAAPLTVLT